MRSASKWMIFSLISMMVFCGTAFGADSVKIGLVDFQRLVDDSNAGKSIKAELNAKGKKMEAELKQKGSEIEALKKTLEREAMVMDKDMREQKERDFRIKIGDFKSLQKKYEGDLQELKNNLMRGLQEQTLQIIDDIGKSGGYLMILDKRSVIYSRSNIDITDEVIKRHDALKGKKGK
ncbi:putative Outer membrane protein (Skp protein) [Desulfosarcina cetonica]|nr:putative Outer membrane protein (Skp protein) [Desulfosarcina cetonica]